MPSVDNPDRTIVRSSSDRGIVFTSKRIKIKMLTSFDENELQWFVFENIKVDVLRPFLMTKVNMEKYKKATRARAGASITAKVDTGLVLANHDGTEKLYLMHFHNLSRETWQALMHTIKRNNPHITYLMTKSEHNNLFP